MSPQSITFHKLFGIELLGGEEMWRVYLSEKIARKRTWSETASLLHGLDEAVEISVTRDVGELRHRVKRSVSNGEKKFVAAGGDGSIHFLVNELMRYKWSEPPILGILPLGSGCDLSRSLNIPNRPTAAANLLRQSHTRKIDLGLACGEWGERYFVNVASMGLTAEVVRAVRNGSMFGACRYIAAFWLTLPRCQARRFFVSAFRNHAKEKAILAVIANGKFFGGGLQVAPQAELDDGQLEVLTLSASRIQVPYVLYRLRSATHCSLNCVKTTSARETKVISYPPTSIELDGEYLGCMGVRGNCQARNSEDMLEGGCDDKPVSFEVVPGAIRVVDATTV